MEKMELLNDLWKNNVRADAHLGSDVCTAELSEYCVNNNVRFLVTFKKAVYSTIKKVKSNNNILIKPYYDKLLGKNKRF